jgi:hypothetical protein
MRCETHTESYLCIVCLTSYSERGPKWSECRSRLGSSSHPSHTKQKSKRASERAQVRRRRAGPTAAAGYGPIYALNCHFAYIFVPDVPVAPLPAVPGVCLHFRDSTPIFFDRQLIPYTSATNLVSMDLWLSPAHLWPVEMLHTPPGPIEDAPVRNSGG